MARIAGVDIPNNKRVEIALTYIYGIGRTSSNKILAKREDANFVLYCGRKLLIKRKRFDQYIDHELVI